MLADLRCFEGSVDPNQLLGEFGMFQNLPCHLGEDHSSTFLESQRASAASVFIRVSGWFCCSRRVREFMIATQ